jgi:hypothetical protein
MKTVGKNPKILGIVDSHFNPHEVKPDASAGWAALRIRAVLSGVSHGFPGVSSVCFVCYPIVGSRVPHEPRSSDGDER